MIISKPLTVLFGGPSEERLVSVASAQNIARSLPEATYWFWQPTGAIVSCSAAELLRHDRPFECDFEPTATPLYSILVEALDAPVTRDLIFFLALHGTAGEDGHLQSLLEQRGMAFTGSGAKSSKDAFDKRVAKRIVAANGIRVAPEFEIQGNDPGAAQLALVDMLTQHRDIIAKPVASGSSVGLLRLRGFQDVADAVSHLEDEPKIRYLVEPFLEGREITVGVYQQNSAVIALPPSEVLLEPGASFDYQGKYLGKGSREITPADLPTDLVTACQNMAREAHKALGCFGYSRTDMIITRDGPVFLETNTLPGLSTASFIPQQLAAAGIPFKDFLLNQIELGSIRKAQKL